MRAVIAAGGRGTRLLPLGRSVPKPLFPVLGEPVLARTLRALSAQGFTEVCLTLSPETAGPVRNLLGDGSRFSLSLSYYVEREPLGTAGALGDLRDFAAGEPFFFLCADLIFDVDFSRFLSAHQKNGGVATVLAHPNDHPFDSLLLEADESGRVRRFLPPGKDREDCRNCAGAGIYLFSPAVFDRIPTPRRADLDRDLLFPLCREGKLFLYRTPEYVKDMGTPERLSEAERDLAAGRVARQSLRHLQKVFFLDRDGTINRSHGYLRSPEEMALLPGAAEAVRMLNRRGYPVVVVTNQPGIARGELTAETLGRIHARMETLLGKEGAYINDLYYCPHHPDGGFPGEIPALKRVCDCRKPAPGMILTAAARYHADLPHSFMIGDSWRDVEAGKRAGCRTAAIGDVPGADFSGDTLLSCVKQILEEEQNRE
ncbi:MAG: HAD-IIIA family hydrolase [Clostridia bacterium]|nr:HAD-IIIA family hydrolase [Clostridia bacterium]